MKTNKNLPLFLVIFLLILYALSFITTNRKNTPKPVKTALMNGKYKPDLTEFNFETDESTLFFAKKDELWFVNTNENPETFLPANNQKVSQFINDLTTIVNLYKISDGKNKNSSHNFTNSASFSVNYNNFSILFGNYDFSKSYRYVSTNTSNTVYQIETSLDKYLTTSVLAWTEPYILSRQFVNVEPETIQSVIIKTSNIQKKIKPAEENFKDILFSFMELRHGGIISAQEDLQYTKLIPDLQMEFECGDTSEIKLEIFPTQNQAQYIIKSVYKPALTKKEYVIYEKISSWTYSKIKEIML